MSNYRPAGRPAALPPISIYTRNYIYTEMYTARTVTQRSRYFLSHRMPGRPLHHSLRSTLAKQSHINLTKNTSMIITATQGDLRLAQLPFIIDMLFIVYVRKLCYRGSGLNYLLRLSRPAGRFCCMPYMSLYSRKNYSIYIPIRPP